MPILLVMPALLSLHAAPSLPDDAVQLRPGDVVFLRGASPRGVVVRLVDGGDYSHVCMAVDRETLVDASPAGEGPGEVHLRSLHHLMGAGELHGFDVYRVEATEAARAIAVNRALQMLRDRVGFDDDYRPEPDRVYCTELVWHCYREAGVELVDDRFRTLSLGLLHRQDLILPGSLLESGRLRLVCRADRISRGKDGSQWFVRLSP